MGQSCVALFLVFKLESPRFHPKIALHGFVHISAVGLDEYFEWPCWTTKRLCGVSSVVLWFADQQDAVQKKTFTKWINSFLVKVSVVHPLLFWVVLLLCVRNIPVVVDDGFYWFVSHEIKPRYCLYDRCFRSLWVGGHLALADIHPSDPSELSHWRCYDDSAVNMVSVFFSK